MVKLDVSYDTSAFEVPAALDGNGRLTADCARKARQLLDEQGFVLISDLLSDDEAAAGLQLVRETLADPEREKSGFASETDSRHGRRDFCPLPSTQPVLSYASALCRRLQDVLVEYCGRSRQVLEISTLTSYHGSSHQYVHRDPEGVLCMFAAVDDVSPEQGGTVLVPGTHNFSGADEAHDGKAMRLMELHQTLSNLRILRYNFANLWRFRRSAEPPVSWKEFRARAFSWQSDDHQPNLLRFLLGANHVFDITNFGPLSLLRLLRHRKALRGAYRLVQAAPKKGTIILYRSDMLHAGPDNRTTKPRFFFNINIARDVIFPQRWRDGYAPHRTLLEDPKTLGDLLDA